MTAALSKPSGALPRNSQSRRCRQGRDLLLRAASRDSAGVESRTTTDRKVSIHGLCPLARTWCEKRKGDGRTEKSPGVVMEEAQLSALFTIAQLPLLEVKVKPSPIDEFSLWYSTEEVIRMYQKQWL